MTKKTSKIIAIGIIVLIAVPALLAYYQKQGYVKVFPTKFELRQKKALKIDESKLLPPDGLSDEDFREIINELYEKRDIVQTDVSQSGEWIEYGNILEFLNDHEAAVEAWEISYELSPTFLAAINIANVNQYFIKDYQKAEKYYFDVLRLNPGDNFAYEGLIDLYRYNYKEKRINFEPIVLQAIKQDAVNKGSYLVHLVDFFSEGDTKDITKARDYLEELKEVDVKKADSLLETYPFL